MECGAPGNDSGAAKKPEYIHVRKGGTLMKKYGLLLTILVSIAAWSGNGLSQCPPNNLGIQKPTVNIINTKNHPDLGNGTYFAGLLFTMNAPRELMNGLQRISAQNINNSQIDGDVFEFGLTPRLRSLTAEFSGYEGFKGQSGTYAVTIERTNRPGASPYLESPFTCYADPIEDGLIPLPVPKNLKVSFKSGATTPTLSFDPVGGFLSDGSEWYEIRIYDKDYTRRIYAVKIGIGYCGSANGNRIPCSIYGTNPSVTYDDHRSVNGQTFEDLVPGEEYIFRAELNKELPIGSELCSSLQCNGISAQNFKRFKVPKK